MTFEDEEALKIVAFKMALAGECVKEFGIDAGEECDKKCPDCWERALREYGEVKEEANENNI